MYSPRERAAIFAKTTETQTMMACIIENKKLQGKRLQENGTCIAPRSDIYIIWYRCICTHVVYICTDYCISKY